MLKILWKMGEIAPEEQFHPLSTIFNYLMLNFYVKAGIRFSLRDKRLFEITEVEITRVDCTYVCYGNMIKFQYGGESISNRPNLFPVEIHLYFFSVIAL